MTTYTMKFYLAISLAVFAAPRVWADEADKAQIPNSVPITRPEMKRALEALKDRKPRIAVPSISEQEAAELGDRADHYEARLRLRYMGHEPQRPRGTQQNDPAMSLSYEFKTMMFWIVARMNNCHYCMGHQELKLSIAGLEDDRIAALDGDWSEFSEAERAAFAFAKMLTYRPHAITDADLSGLSEHFSDLQILEMAFSVAGNNSINRWKESIGVPQERDGSLFRSFRTNPIPADRPLPLKSFLTPTSEKYLHVKSALALVRSEDFTSRPDAFEAQRRPPLESPARTEELLTQAMNRKPRLPLADNDQTREVMGQDWPAIEYPQWVRLLAQFPRDGKSRALTIRAIEEKGDVDPLLKAQIGWIAAREDRAWCLIGRAKARLLSLGQTEEDIYRLDGPWDSYTPGHRAAFHLARKIMRAPDLLTDEDVAQVTRTLGDCDTVQLIAYIAQQAFLTRLTEAAGLPPDGL